MVNYTYESLFRQDSVDKQLIITDGDITLTNVDIYQESFELEEVLSPTRDLTYGSCNSATLRFTTSRLEKYKGRTFTVSVVLDGHTEEPFTFGTYKVYEDVYTADRTKKDLVLHDALYEVLNANVIDWYNTLLPDMETTVTLKQFRDSFFSHFGITQETITLDNDTETISKTVDGEVLSGADVLRRICEMNGVFGRINRAGNFEYFYVHATNNPLYPALTLYPDTNLFPSFDGQYDANEIGENGTYISAKYEDFDCMPVDKLIIRQEDGDAGVEIGTGTNKYIIQGNFLLFGKSVADLTRIANKIYTHIADGAYYRPCEIELKGNPCIEIGDGIALVTRNNDRIVTFVTHRVYSGIQAQRDLYSAEGTEYRGEDVNSYDTQLRQLRNKSNILTRDLEHTESVITDEILDPDNPTSLQSQITQTAEDITSEVTRATNAEGSLSTRITQNATDITAKVNKNSPTGQTSFSWEMTDSKMEWKQNNNQIMLLNSSGLELSGKVTATSGYIGNGSSGFTISSNAIYNGVTSLSDTNHNGIYAGTDGIRLGKTTVLNNDGQIHITTNNDSGNNSILRLYDSATTEFAYINPSGVVIGQPNQSSLNLSRARVQASNLWVGALNGTPTFYGDSGITIHSENGRINVEFGSGSPSADRVFYIDGSLQVTGNKNRVVTTSKGKVGLNAIESAECYFSDMGSAECENGIAEVVFDELFSETIDTTKPYIVSLTPTSDNTGWVEKKSDRFIIHSNGNATFDWIVYCKQKDYADIRLEKV